jgi:hypothetical protein
LANLVLFIMAGTGLTLGGVAVGTKAETKTVDNQAITVQVTREDLNAVTSRVDALERFSWKQKALNKAEREYVIQVLKDGKVAIIQQPPGLPPATRPIESHWPTALPGRPGSDPILIVTTPYPSLEWVTE